MKITFLMNLSDSFAGNVLKLLTGTVLAQAIALLVMPILTRLFAPEAFGLFTVFTAMTGIIGVIACFRYESAIMLPESNEEAVNILGVSLVSVVIVTLFSGLIVWKWNEIIISLLHTPQLKYFLWFVPVAVFFQGIFLALTNWNSRGKKFGRISISQFLSSLTAQVTKLVAGVAGFVSSSILIGAQVLGCIVASVILGGQIWQYDHKLILDHIRWKSIFKAFVRYRKFLFIDTWGGLLNAISWQLPTLMLVSFFSSSVVGFYALGVMVIKAPLGILVNALSQVFYQKACDEKNLEGSNSALVAELMDVLMFIGIIPVMVIAVIGEEIFTVVFGGNWSEAGRYSQILAPWLFFWFISSPLSSIFLVYERQESAFIVNCIIFLTRVGSLYIGAIHNNIYLALSLFSVTGIVSYVFYAAWNIKLAQANGKTIFINFLKYIAYSIPLLLSLFIVKFILKLDSIPIIILAVLMITFYVIISRNRIISLYRNVN